MKIFLRLQILFFLILFTSCNIPWCKISFADRLLNYYTSQMSEDYGAMYEYASNPPRPRDYLVQLVEIMPSGWDSMVWISDSLKSGEISKIIGSQYEDKGEYQGKQKLIFMDKGKIADIYALRSQDSVTFIPGDVQYGYAKVSRDTWFTVRGSDTAFILKRFGVSDIHLSKNLSEKKSPRFEIENESFTFGLSSDTVESNRIGCRGGIDFDLFPLARRMMKTVFTPEQLSYILRNNIFIGVTFSIYHDTGEIFECYWGIDEKYKDFFTDEQIREMSEFMFGTRIDRRLISLFDQNECHSEKRISICWWVNVISSLIY